MSTSPDAIHIHVYKFRVRYIINFGRRNGEHTKIIITDLLKVQTVTVTHILARCVQKLFSRGTKRVWAGEVPV